MIGLLDGEVAIDGQRIRYYHTDHGRLARIKGVTLAVDLLACWPPCNAEHCAPVREFMQTKEYTG